MHEVSWYRVQWLNHSSVHSVVRPTQGLIAGLNDHLWKDHDIQPSHFQRQFECPFSCRQQPWHKMSDLLRHCEKEHNENLGKTTVTQF